MQHWEDPDTLGETDIKGVFNSHEKACNLIQTLYKEDIQWAQEWLSVGEELDEDIAELTHSYVSTELRRSENYIVEANVE